MRRLYIQIYLTVVVSLVLVVAGAGAMWRFAAESAPWTQGLAMAGEVAAAALPAPDAPPEAQRQALARLSERLRADLALYDRDFQLVAAATLVPGAAVPLPGRERRGPFGGEDARDGHDGRGWRINLPDGRRLAVRLSPERRFYGPFGSGWLTGLAALALIALAVGVAAHPVVRRITRRLERLEKSVNALGEGDLSARVKVHGHDEVARLARSFNRAAGRIESLVRSHRNLLANASHELRTPLARIRMGVELMKSQPPGADLAAREAQLEADIAELDALIEEILTASRLEAGAGTGPREDVDLLALLAEECARYDDCRLDGDPAHLRGDPRLLRRLARNLLENAKRHGAPPIEVTLRHATQGDGGGKARPVVELCVRDHGPGVPDEAREKIFDPFFRLPGSTATGTGLGLSLVRQIAREHGGDARLVPAAGGGTCIEVVLAPLG